MEAEDLHESQSANVCVQASVLPARELRPADGAKQTSVGLLQDTEPRGAPVAESEAAIMFGARGKFESVIPLDTTQIQSDSVSPTSTDIMQTAETALTPQLLAHSQSDGEWNAGYKQTRVEATSIRASARHELTKRFAAHQQRVLARRCTSQTPAGNFSSIEICARRHIQRLRAPSVRVLCPVAARPLGRRKSKEIRASEEPSARVLTCL